MLTREYGITVDVEFESWERQYQSLRRNAKFGNLREEDNPFLQLKSKLLHQLYRNLEKKTKLKKFLWLAITAPILVLLLLPALVSVASDAALGILLLSFCPLAYYIWRNRFLSNYFLAIMDFDEKYFDGEILYAYKNGTNFH